MSIAKHKSRSSKRSGSMSVKRRSRKRRSNLASHRLVNHPLIPLILIAALAAALTLFSSRRPQDEVPESTEERWQPDEQYSDARYVMDALKLMDAGNFDEAATALQQLTLSPVRLSELMVAVRSQKPEAGERLVDILDEWLLVQLETEPGLFPSKRVSNPALQLVMEIASYYGSERVRERHPELEAELQGVFRRASIEHKLRLLDMPLHKREAGTTF